MDVSRGFRGPPSWTPQTTLPGDAGVWKYHTRIWELTDHCYVEDINDCVFTMIYKRKRFTGTPNWLDDTLRLKFSSRYGIMVVLNGGPYGASIVYWNQLLKHLVYVTIQSPRLKTMLNEKYTQVLLLLANISRYNFYYEMAPFYYNIRQNTFYALPTTDFQKIYQDEEDFSLIHCNRVKNDVDVPIEVHDRLYKEIMSVILILSEVFAAELVLKIVDVLLVIEYEGENPYINVHPLHSIYISEDTKSKNIDLKNVRNSLFSRYWLR